MADDFNQVDKDKDEIVIPNFDYVDHNVDKSVDEEFNEEAATEFTAPTNSVERRDNGLQRDDEAIGKGVGWLGLALSIISLFIWPVILGAAGIIVGFIARRRGEKTLGTWAIGIGVASIIIGIFIAPFF